MHVSLLTRATAAVGAHPPVVVDGDEDDGVGDDDDGERDEEEEGRVEEQVRLKERSKGLDLFSRTDLE